MCAEFLRHWLLPVIAGYLGAFISLSLFRLLRKRRGTLDLRYLGFGDVIELNYMSVQELLNTDGLRYRLVNYFAFQTIPIAFGYATAYSLVGLYVGQTGESVIIAGITVFLFSSIRHFRVVGNRQYRYGVRCFNGLSIAWIALIGLFLSLVHLCIFELTWILPSLDGIRDNAWAALIVTVIVLWFFEITDMSGKSVMDSKLEGDSTNGVRAFRNRARKVVDKHRKQVRNLASQFDLDPNVMLTLLVYEDWNRPPLVRIIENLLVRLPRVELTVGIAQVTSTKPLSDSESIEIMAKLLSKSLAECGECQTKHEKYQRALRDYNDTQYAHNVFELLRHLEETEVLCRTTDGDYITGNNESVVDQRNGESDTDNENFEWGEPVEFLEEIAGWKTAPSNVAKDSDVEDESDAIEAIIARVERFNAGVEIALRKSLQRSSSDSFMQAVTDLLWSLGFVAPYAEMRNFDDSQINGISGVVYQEAFRFQKVYIQAKQYEASSNVDTTTINDFYAAIDQAGAAYGIFLTTSRFAQETIDAAARYNGKVILIDGARMAALMLERNIAVQKILQFQLYQVNDTYFYQ